MDLRRYGGGLLGDWFVEMTVTPLMFHVKHGESSVPGGQSSVIDRAQWVSGPSDDKPSSPEKRPPPSSACRRQCSRLRPAVIVQPVTNAHHVSRETSERRAPGGSIHRPTQNEFPGYQSHRRHRAITKRSHSILPIHRRGSGQRQLSNHITAPSMFHVKQSPSLRTNGISEIKARVPRETLP